MYQIINQTSPLNFPIRAKYCHTFLCRLKGLTFRRQLEPQEGLLLVQKRQNRSDASIHMLFVWTDLAVIWIDEQLLVVDVQLAKSWRPMYVPKAPARYVLEVAPARLPEFQIGDQLSFEKDSI